MLLCVLLVHAALIAAVASMRSVLHAGRSAEPVSVTLFRWPGFARTPTRPKEASARLRSGAREARKERQALPSLQPATGAPPTAPATASATAPPQVPAAPPASGLLPEGVGRIIAEHARCYGFQLTEEERARCARRDVGREEQELPLNIAPSKVQAWEAGLQRRRESPATPIAPCAKETGGSNLGTGCMAHGSGVRVPLP